MDKPVAKLDIPPTFGGFDAPEVECFVPDPSFISEKGDIFQINLQKKNTKSPFRFLKYQEACQLGRFFGLSINDSSTRLYTLVNFLV
jgi:hypothetical protein